MLIQTSTYIYRSGLTLFKLYLQLYLSLSMSQRSLCQFVDTIYIPQRWQRLNKSNISYGKDDHYNFVEKRLTITDDLEKHINVKHKKSILSHFSPPGDQSWTHKAVAALIKAKPIQIETEQPNLIKRKINFKADETAYQTIISTSWSAPNLISFTTFWLFKVFWTSLCLL